MNDFLEMIRNYKKDMPSNIPASEMYVPESQDLPGPVTETTSPASEMSMPESQPAPSDVSQDASLASEIDPRLKQALEERDRRERAAMLLSAFRKFAQAGVSASGSDAKISDDAEKFLMNRANYPVKDFQTSLDLSRAKEKLNQDRERHQAVMKEYAQKLAMGEFDLTNKERLMDASSPESKLAQQFLLDMNPNLDKKLIEQTPADQLYRNYLPQMQSLIFNKMRIEAQQGQLAETQRRNAILEDMNQIRREKEQNLSERFEKNLEFGKERFVNKKQEKNEDQRATIVKDFEKDKVVQKSNEMSASADTVLELVNSENPIGHAAIPTFMARASGEVGALTEADKAPFGGSQAMLSRIKQITEKYKSGELTPENQRFITELAGTMKMAAMRNKARRAFEYQPKKSKAFNLDQKEVFHLLMPQLSLLPDNDRKAVEWALKNPNKPESKQILKLNGF